MDAERLGGGRSERSSPQIGVVVNGWTIFTNPLFLDQLESLVLAVASEINISRCTLNNDELEHWFGVVTNRGTFGSIGEPRWIHASLPAHCNALQDGVKQSLQTTRARGAGRDPGH